MMLGERTLVMGVVNLTADSFSDGGLYLDPERAVEHALQLLDEGADLIDLGAESTRPGSGAGGPEAIVSADEEQARLLPVLAALRKARPEAIVSVDTYKASTAHAAVAAGAEIVNDVSGLMWDEAMAATCAALQCGVVLMHTRGRPAEWKTQPALPRGSALPLVLNGLANGVAAALEAGIQSESLVLDPGYGFGKRFGENFDLLAGQPKLLALGYPLLAGVSRKSFLSWAFTGGKAPGAEDLRTTAEGESREFASVAAMVAAILKGASIVRVHDVRSAVAAAAIADAVLAGEQDQTRLECGVGEGVMSASTTV
jgi:dihydropteroate synthase